jgi:rhodanese-related sulfurtransferase
MKSFKFHLILFVLMGLSSPAIAADVESIDKCKHGYVGVELFTSCVDDVLAFSGRALPEKKRSALGLYMTAMQVYENVSNQNQKTLFIDIRTVEEVNFVGIPAMVDANIPYMQIPEWKDWDEKTHNLKLEPNSNFAALVGQWMDKKHMNKSDIVILMCRSGDRSAKAADLLASLGYTKVYSVVDGFEGDLASAGAEKGHRAVNGWKNSLLPWSYEVDLNKVAINQ